MPSDNFWKKVVVFSLALLLGFLTADFFEAKNPSVRKFADEQVLTAKDFTSAFPHSKDKNCVPADESLKHQTLPFDKTDTDLSFHNLPYPDLNNKYLSLKIERLVRLRVEISELNSDLEQLDESDAKKESEIKGKLEKLEEELLKESEIYPKPQTLLYLEKCSDNK